MIKTSGDKAFIEYEFVNPRNEKMGLYRIPLGRFMEIVERTNNLAELRLAIIENAERDNKGSEEIEQLNRNDKRKRDKARIEGIK